MKSNSVVGITENGVRVRTPRGIRFLGFKEAMSDSTLIKDKQSCQIGFHAGQYMANKKHENEEKNKLPI